MMRQRKGLALVLVATAAFAVGFAAPQMAAAQSMWVAPAEAVPPPQAPAGTTVVDAAQMEEIVDIVRRIDPYLYVDATGLVRLKAVTAAELGVTEKFLADYRSAMAHSNVLIQRGEIKVARDLTVTMIGKPALPPGGEAAVDGSAAGAADDGVDASGPVEAVPQWGAWNYGQGAMFFNSYADWTYYRHNYYGLCNGMAAWLGMPYMGPILIYFYGYNQYYFVMYCYPTYGTYFYIPYGYVNYPFGYKPGYFWAQQYGYCGNCRCYCYQWMWLGFWLRY